MTAPETPATETDRRPFRSAADFVRRESRIRGDLDGRTVDVLATLLERAGLPPEPVTRRESPYTTEKTEEAAGRFLMRARDAVDAYEGALTEEEREAQLEEAVYCYKRLDDMLCRPGQPVPGAWGRPAPADRTLT